MALTFSPNAEIGFDCPDFSLPGVDGKVYSRNSFKNDKPLVIMFICNHCPYVQAIEDRLIQLVHDLKTQDVHVIAICSNDAGEYPEDNFENLKKRALQKNYPFVYLHDATQEVAMKFGAVCTPDFFIFDKNLKLASRNRLDDSWKNPREVAKRELFEIVQLLLKGEKAPEKQIPSMGCNIKWKI